MTVSKRRRRLFSIRQELLRKSREAALAAVQIFNNPNVTFKSETYTVLMNIAWTYLLHAYYRGRKVDYRYFADGPKRRKFDRTRHGAFKHWEHERCLNDSGSRVRWPREGGASMTIVNLTADFKDPNVDWSRRGRAFADQFPVRARITRGVYAHICVNTSRFAVYDKNHGGRLRIHPDTTMVKVGKFVGGLAPRMMQNHVHLHRRRGGRPWEEKIFPAILECLFVLNLDHRRKDEIRGIETEWNQSIRAVLHERDLIHLQNPKGEAINLRGRITCDQLLAVLNPVAARLSP